MRLEAGRRTPQPLLLELLHLVDEALALLADMMGRHRRISEELLYLARKRVYATQRASKRGVR